MYEIPSLNVSQKMVRKNHAAPAAWAETPPARERTAFPCPSGDYSALRCAYNDILGPTMQPLFLAACFQSRLTDSFSRRYFVVNANV
jgi:hypothetical protein